MWTASLTPPAARRWWDKEMNTPPGERDKEGSCGQKPVLLTAGSFAYTQDDRLFQPISSALGPVGSNCRASCTVRKTPERFPLPCIRVSMAVAAGYCRALHWWV